MRKIVSYALGLSVGLLAVAPPINYTIPVVINSFWWLYAVVVCALLAFWLCVSVLPVMLRVLAIYIFVNCFLSMSPYLSFNAFMLVVGALLCFILFLYADYKIILNFVFAAFFVQIAMLIFQLFGMDKLMNFDRPEPVFFGTVMQYMRLASLFAISAPLLILKNRLFIVPLIVLCVMSSSSSFALALAAGVTVYYILKTRRYYIGACAFLCFMGFFIFRDWASWHAEMAWGRWTVWPDIIRSWCMNTLYAQPPHLVGPIDLKSIFFGRGLDTFMPLFPLFKHDPNPFAQAHCDFLQILWELGVVGAGILCAYMASLVYRLRRSPKYLAGLACMSVNMFFAFPTRMTQTMLMMVAFIGMCEQEARKAEGERYA